MIIKYFINKEERTVVCVLEQCEYDFIDFMSRLDNPLTYAPPRFSYRMPSAFHGRARCSEEDTWDEEYGKRLAYHRAKNAHDRSLFNRCNKLMNYIDKKSDELADTFALFGHKLSRNFERREKELKIE